MTARTAAGLEVKIQRLAHGEGLPLPGYATAGSAGLDLAAAVTSDLVLPPGGRALVPTGLAIALPEGHEAQIRPRSGLAAKCGITILNAPGTVDSDYRGEIMVCLINLGDRPFTVSRGDRIAQMVVAPVSNVVFQTTESLDSTVREAAGFGSTGVRDARVAGAKGGAP